MKKLSIEKPSALVETRISELEKAQKGLSSAAAKQVLNDMIGAYRAVQTDLHSPAFKDPYRDVIFSAQARLRDRATPSHQAAVYSEIIQLMASPGSEK